MSIRNLQILTLALLISLSLAAAPTEKQITAKVPSKRTIVLSAAGITAILLLGATLKRNEKKIKLWLQQ